MANEYAHMNQELLAIINEDQADRAAAGLHADYLKRDRARRARVREIVAAGALPSADDYLVAALVFQHGETIDDYWQAHELAVKSKEMGHPLGPWLAAAAMDRYLNRQGKPVKYGTQYVLTAGIYRVPHTDPATTDEERQEWGVPPLAKLLAMDKGQGMPPTETLGALSVPGLTVTVLSLPRPLTFHTEMLPDRAPTGMTSPSGAPVWRNLQAWSWAEAPDGSLQIGWWEMPYAPELGHMVVKAAGAALEAGEAAGRPAIWVSTGDDLWTLYARTGAGDRVWAVTGRDRAEVGAQMERLL